MKFYPIVAKRLNLKVTKFWGLISTFVEVTEEKLIRGTFLPPPTHTHLNRVNDLIQSWVGIDSLISETDVSIMQLGLLPFFPKPVPD